PGLRQFALKPAALLDQCRHPTRRILRRDLQQRGDLLELFVTLLEIAARRRTRQRLDPAHAGSDRTLGDQSHETNVAGAPDMGTTAQFERVGLAGLAAPRRRA